MKVIVYSIVFIGALSLLIWLGVPWYGYVIMIVGFLAAVGKIEEAEKENK
jgi:hypothetical protein